MRYKSLYIALLLVPLSFLGAWGQKPPSWLLVGPYGGFNGGLLSGSIPVYAGSSDCGIFRSGMETGPQAGARMLLPSLFSDHLGLSAQVTWGQTTGTFEAIPVGNELVVDPETGTPVTLDRRYRLEMRTTTLQLDLLAQYNLGGGWSLAIGPRLGYRLAVHSTQTDNVLGPGDLGLVGGHRSVVMSDGITFTSNPLLFGLSVAASHELPVGHNTILVPGLITNVELSSPVKEARANSFSLQAGAALLFDITPEPTPPLAPPPPAPEPVVAQVPPRTPRLSASIRLNSVNDSGRAERVTVVRATEVLYRKYTPLLPAIFFDRDSTSFPSRYVHDNGTTPDSLALALLHGMRTLEVHRNNPGVIGMRMQKNPNAALTLYGVTSLDESSTLAHKRAEAMRDYLEQTWGIDHSRIRIAESGNMMAPSGQGTDDGRAEDRRVEFASNKPAILAPIASERVVRDFNPPSIAMEPTMEAEAGVKRWTITIRQGGNLVAQYSSDDSTESKPDLTWHIADDRIDSIPSPISVELAVEDSTGATTTAHDELPIIFERRLSIVEKRGEEDADRISYRLVAFDYNSSEPSQEHLSTLHEIAATIDTGSHVRVVGYTDRIGGEGYNADLSHRRAARVASLLQGMLEKRALHNVHIASEAGGIEAERFGNDSPEGRILSRGVLVVVEHERNSRVNRP